MVTFSVPLKEKKQVGLSGCFRFSVKERSVLFAGSRYGHVPERTTLDLIQQFHLHGFGYFTGCANGIDSCFRKVLSRPPYNKKAFVACAFRNRARKYSTHGVFASVVVPENLHPKAALHRRTLWMVRRCSLVVLFPENPYDLSWGKGSRLVLTSSMLNLKPVFVVCSKPPESSYTYRILPSTLFGSVSGYWIVPHPTEDGGTCEDEY